MFVFSYSQEDTQEEAIQPSQGSEFTFACRCGEAHCTLLHYTDKHRYPMAATEVDVDIPAKLVIEPNLQIAKDMPLALKIEGRTLAEGSIFELLSRGS